MYHDYEKINRPCRSCPYPLYACEWMYDAGTTTAGTADHCPHDHTANNPASNSNGIFRILPAMDPDDHGNPEWQSPATLTGATTKFGNGIIIGPIVSTKKYCEINGQQEATYLQVLQDTMAYTVNLNQLSLTDKDQNVLVFKVPSAVPTTA